MILGLEKPARPGRPCFAHQVKQCRGACVGKETVGVHSVRMKSALMKLKLTAWPYPGAIGVVERDELRQLEEVHVVNGWRHLGSAARPRSRKSCRVSRVRGGSTGIPTHCSPRIWERGECGCACCPGGNESLTTRDSCRERAFS